MTQPKENRKLYFNLNKQISDPSDFLCTYLLVTDQSLFIKAYVGLLSTKMHTVSIKFSLPYITKMKPALLSLYSSMHK